MEEGGERGINDGGVAYLHENVILGVLLKVPRDELKLLLGRHWLWCCTSKNKRQRKPKSG